MNWISATGRIPAMAIPKAAPTMPDSATGVSNTRSSPYLSRNPSVIRNTPPVRPMSSPRSTTRSSDSRAVASAPLSAWARVSSVISRSPPAAPR